jgi:hypothetical protein
VRVALSRDETKKATERKRFHALTPDANDLRVSQIYASNMTTFGDQFLLKNTVRQPKLHDNGCNMLEV